MKKLLVLSTLLMLSFSLSKTSLASGSCTPNYLGYSSVSCTFTGDGNVLDFYYFAGGATIYQNLWGSVGSGGVYVYNYITTPNGFTDIAISSGEPDENLYTSAYNNSSGTIVLYTESVGSNNSGGVSASW